MAHLSRLELISDLERQIHGILKHYISPDEPLAILGFPDIRNCGDSAIWLGEIAYLRKYFSGKTPDYVSRRKDFSAAELRRRVPVGPVFIQGGGTFGDIWPGHQGFRESLLTELTDRRIIQFPQSIHFNDAKRIDASARAIDRHGDFVLLVRDEQSLEFAEKHFNCAAHLCPDMAFAIGPLSRPETSIPVLAMLRDDRESARKTCESSAWAWPDIPQEDWITENRRSVDRVKRWGWLSALAGGKPAERRFRMLNAAANQRLMKRGIPQISRARAIVTDRLHVHICSLLLGRPHAVLDNNYGKVRGYLAAFSGGTDFSYLASSLEDGIAWAQSQAENCTHF
ncbi:polysaccharide pyruvyl transferase family protein [Halochromatium roseum]|uniref:polysaccharide pyruvyl transferase family protein n=1 Tax=Halochromatium roseum TaxID=391920 RepID=UPI0019133E30|nr:polysaccharide pyruvyl transferase family protein [Halochromatium roseum]MBK5940357.1 exopolysaccharide biosynthesis protein [Halochromatium roseum]